MKCICGRQLVFTPRTVNGAAVFADCYLLLVTCGSCGSTRSAIMHESVQAALERVADEIVSEPQELAAE